MNDCTLCPLHQTCINSNIGGRGPEHADILIVGQSPSGEEDLAGECFVGRIGVLLDEMLIRARCAAIRRRTISRYLTASTLAGSI